MIYNLNAQKNITGEKNPKSFQMLMQDKNLAVNLLMTW